LIASEDGNQILIDEDIEVTDHCPLVVKRNESPNPAHGEKVCPNGCGLSRVHESYKDHDCLGRVLRGFQISISLSPGSAPTPFPAIPSLTFLQSETSKQLYENAAFSLKRKQIKEHNKRARELKVQTRQNKIDRSARKRARVQEKKRAYAQLQNAGLVQGEASHLPAPSRDRDRPDSTVEKKKVSVDRRSVSPSPLDAFSTATDTEALC
jgi:hypothetical protein